MSYRGGGGRGGGNYKGRGGGRGGSNFKGRGVGGTGRGHPVLGHGVVTPCANFVKNGNCSYGDKCFNAHDMQLISTVKNSNQDTSSNSKGNDNYNHNRYDSRNNRYSGDKFHPTTDVALWIDKPEVPLKIFTSSHDGFWRLYNTANGQFQKEVEHNMNGKVHTVLVVDHFLFCGFEAASVKIPNQLVGMIFAWNLSNPGEAPMELHMGNLAPYAHSKGVSKLLTHKSACFSGGQDHVVRIWEFDVAMNQGKGGFRLIKECCGHVGTITGLVFLNDMLWSSSTDGTIRLWDSKSNWECKHLITGSNPAATAAVGALSPTTQNGSEGVGHTDAITSLIHFKDEQTGASYILSSSLDGNIKVWDSANGNCLSTSAHGSGVVSMALSKSLGGKPILLCGTEKGEIIIRGILQTEKTAPMAYLCSLNPRFYGYSEGSINSIVAGPPNTNYEHTFYTASNSGAMMIWQICGNLGMS
mmetsp:Transcript_8544/g.12818  ORF Transcript_8544/g.12818 Transcript_8544/m.12818 type:complete len:470 (-) Transcript_8544:203-1612(-)|eukprot:CAMPEP_0203663132 /NCGR_PEP_ID=MMETSP0090-20130426/839_1 /ASSEMBLY_ACC=CAM_ASM_001088 /TAXON_ID=426623 /ORGANISM="Chaetoceros affinis, Strain CCMP159" /LENGTH=469 /DNA_ID=CAMNT_0050526001 /DNA_START=164 /DNA_END=1573 /DNA_ORIENTATION=-